MALLITVSVLFPSGPLLSAQSLYPLSVPVFSTPTYTHLLLLPLTPGLDDQSIRFSYPPFNPRNAIRTWS